MGTFQDLTGQRFNKLTVLGQAERNKCGTIRWLCQCDCGNRTKTTTGDLKQGKTKSCGCLSRSNTTIRNYKHGHSPRDNHTKTYHSWMGMRNRCDNPKNIRYERYGGRGIKICERWNKFKNFLSDMGEKPKGLTIERINNNKDYTPDNCKWATYTEQAQNSCNAKLIPTTVRIIRKLAENPYFTRADLAYAFRVNWSTIDKVVKRKTWVNII